MIGHRAGSESRPERGGLVMIVWDALNAGDLAAAIAMQEQTVREQPSDRGSQVLLAQLHLLAGGYREAWQRIRALSKESSESRNLRRRLLRLIRADYRRCERGISPAFLEPDAPRHAVQRWKAIQALRRGELAWASRAIDRADAVAPALVGHLDGREFDGFRDADDRFASILELFIEDEYAWIPWEEIRLLRFATPQSFFDLAYRPGQVWLWDERIIQAIVPLIYPGTTQNLLADAEGGRLACGLDTDWRPDQGGLAIGIGARFLLAGDEELAMKDCQQIEFRRA